ncbi:hypothetical protein [Nocardiopsis tropica]|uniref:C2H2-type domain-containing protein n=1 Tax=Nocardiopsis tropica TaxID=109330 RepID=A0ABU7KMT1_9ACTN|nr:hypothetical protein [Nocardiopsis umidischolae]MEE2050324.1 hypothetical protein [Nocardiopsis umidischolae]
MTAHPIGSITLNGTVTCNLCPWAASDRLDPVGALKDHRTTDHPGALPTAPASTRHAAGIVLGALLVVGFGALTAAAWTAGGWWTIAAIPCGLMSALGAFGIAQDAQRAPRDGKGRRLR